MAQPIIFATGDKGGVGKSAVAGAVAEILGIDSPQPILGIDADHRNPSFKEQLKACPFVRVERASLVDRGAIVNLIGLIADNPEVSAVVDLPAGAAGQFQIHAQVIESLLADLGRPVRMIWTLSRARAALVSLVTSLPQLVKISSSLLVVRNLHWGEPDKFVRFNDSTLAAVLGSRMDREEIVRRAVPGTIELYDAIQSRRLRVAIADFPDLHDATFDAIMDAGAGVTHAAASLKFVHRSLSTSWLKAVGTMVEQAKQEGVL